LLPFVRAQWLDDDGAILAGGKLYVYLAGTSTPTDTYTQSDLDPAHKNANPVVLDSAGRATVYLDPSITYKFVMKDADNVTLWTNDNVPGIIPITAPTTFERDGIGTTSTDAAIILNATAAANASQQYAPRVRWTGAGWNATANASRVVDAIAEAVPYQNGSGDPDVALVVSTQVNAGGYTPRLAVRSNGQVIVGASSGILSFGSSGVTSPDVELKRIGTGLLAIDDLTGGSHGVVLKATTDDTLTIRNRSNSADGTLATGGLTASGLSALSQTTLTYTGQTVASVRSDNTGTYGGINIDHHKAGGQPVINFQVNGGTDGFVYWDGTVFRFTSTLCEQSRTYAMGVSQTRTFAAGNFTAATGSWTVDSGDVTSETYRVVGDTMWYSVNIVTSTLSNNTASVTIAKPSGFTLAETVKHTGVYALDVSGVVIPSIVTATSGGNFVVTRQDGSNFSASTNLFYLAFQIVVKVS
jgi:hypothetical protein